MAATGRRQFLASLLAAGLIPQHSWADAGSPAFLSAAATPDGRFVLCGIDAGLNIVFQLPLPDRGHAAAAHPTRPEAVAFARRPGTFALIIDCRIGQKTTELHAPAGRHFYGHGAFSKDGTRLFTTENDYEAGRGKIGVWDVNNGYSRIDEWDSGGIGPHDIKRLPETDTLVVANGGIDTHPDTGRTKLNIPSMRPNLAYIEQSMITETVHLPRDLHKNSIRHLAVDKTGTVAFGMQWQGDGHPTALVGLHQRGGKATLIDQTPDATRQMEGYIGSIAFSADGATVAFTSPRGGLVQVCDTRSGKLARTKSIQDACGIASNGQGFIATSGTGMISTLGSEASQDTRLSRLMFDNHLVSLA